MALKMTKDNVDDRTQIPELSRGLTGVMAADKAILGRIYLSSYMSKVLK